MTTDHTRPMPPACVILAGGRGKRMASADRHKVCFEVLGRPAICRAIDTYKAAGLTRFVVVVGQMAQQVIDTVAAEHPEVTFVYQREPRGTGHAARLAAGALAAQGFDGAVMIAMGDKLTTPEVVRSLIARQTETDADLVLTTLPRPERTRAGRVLGDADGRLLGIVESADYESAVASGEAVQVGDRTVSPGELDDLWRGINGSMYLFRFAPLRDALERLESTNEQNELYLTDTVADLTARGLRAETLRVDDPADLMAFNTPAELMAVEEALRQRRRPARVRSTKRRVDGDRLKPVGHWLDGLDMPDVATHSRLIGLYGNDEELIEDRRRAMTGVLRSFADRFGPDRRVILCRAPGRVNLMGRHVDHRGGYVNVMAINREVLLAAAPREDDTVRLHNTDEGKFPDRDFRIHDLLQEATWTDWMDFVDSGIVRRHLDYLPGDWSHYARAPLLRLQHECRDVPLAGMDCVVSGNIPMGAGLSSSSALVVAFAEAAIALNGLDVAMRDFIDLCGEGEWFVGSRGGSADHAAIRTGKRGTLSRIGFFPFRLEGEVSLPEGLRVVLAHSGAEAVKSASARDVFNQRVACYNIALMLLKRRWPPAASVDHLRDLAPNRLKVRPGEILRALTLLPVNPTRKTLRETVHKDDAEALERCFATHADQGEYDLRGVALFGVSECLRSERFAEVLREGDLDAVGRFMAISHDGDRRVRFEDDGAKPRRFTVRLDDKSLATAAERDAALEGFCGRYACSTEAIDRLVDLSLTTEGVVGAQLAGAGLGGCMMIVVRHDRLDDLVKRIEKQFYRPRRLKSQMVVCTPAAGAGLVRL